MSQFKSHFRLSQAICFILVFGLLLLSGCHSPEARPKPIPQDPLIQVYFNHDRSSGANYTEPYRHLARAGDNLEEVIVKAIASARSSVEVAVQELRLPQIANALAQKYRSGVKVRVILENSYSRPFSELTPTEIARLSERGLKAYNESRILADKNRDGKLTPEEIDRGDALVILRNAGVPVLDDTADGSKGSGLMHHKFVIVDRHSLVTGSANFTLSDIHGDFSNIESRGNANNLLKIEDSTLASLFLEEFDLMWGDGPEGALDSKFGSNKPDREPQTVTLDNTTITVQFSPKPPKQSWESSSNGSIAKTLQRATKSIDIALFVFSEQKLANILETIHQQGVKIRALIDPSFAFRIYSEGLDMLGVFLQERCAHEPNNHPWKVPISSVGVPRLSPGDKLHHKFGIIDKQIVIAGSHNWSASANNNNDETVLIINNPTVAAHFTREFERLYSQAELGVPGFVRQKIREQERECMVKN